MYVIVNSKNEVVASSEKKEQSDTTLRRLNAREGEDNEYWHPDAPFEQKMT